MLRVGYTQSLASRAVCFLYDQDVNGMLSHLFDELMVFGGGAEALYVPGGYFDRSVAGAD